MSTDFVTCVFRLPRDVSDMLDEMVRALALSREDVVHIGVLGVSNLVKRAIDSGVDPKSIVVRVPDSLADMPDGG